MTLTVEWRHLDQGGETCERCADTGAELKKVVAGLQAECGPQGVEIRFIETRLAKDDIGQSNLILINGAPLETMLPGALVSENSCCSCSQLTGREESCRTMIRDNRVHEAIPGEFIREAVCRVAGCC
jgi:hypothetical protein